MLQRIEIHNIALIRALSVDFARGLNVLSGETGAGKSILIDAVNLVLGVRADRELIKAGEQKATVEAVFLDEEGVADAILEELGIEKEASLTLSRDLYASGRNVCRINGSLVNNASLQKVSAQLIDIHGQHEHQSLLDAHRHMALLDALGGEAVAKGKARVRELHAAWRENLRALQSLGGLEGERERRLDILQFQIEEIERADLQQGEEEALDRQRLLIQNSQRMFETFAHTQAMLMGQDGAAGAKEMLRTVCYELRGIASLDQELESLTNEFDEVYYTVEALADRLYDLQQQYEFDPMEAERIGERLDLIHTLKRKYGGSIEAVLQTLHDAQEEQYQLLHAEQMIERLQGEQARLRAQLYSACMELHAKREQTAQILQERVQQELCDLGMTRAQFSVAFAPIAQEEDVQPGDFTQEGLDTLEFLFSANPGQPLRPLSRIVSGGEASRIMLAMKNISAELDGIDCLIFDEVDTGISGQMAHIVAQKMARIAAKRQVLCVTHLAQLACMADAHYLIEKRVQDDQTETQVCRLDADAREREVARLLGGEGEQGFGRKHAQEMIARANQYKQTLHKAK